MKWEKREPPNAGHSKAWQGRSYRQGEKDSDFVLVIFRATLSIASGYRALKGWPAQRRRTGTSGLYNFNRVMV